MRTFVLRLTTRLLHVFCVLALVVSCGLPEALHDLGHALSQTSCEALTKEISQLAQTPTAAHSSVCAKETCWIQTLVTSVAQHATRSTQTPVLVSYPVLSNIVAISLASELVSFDWASWHTSRGPPAV